MPIGLMGLFEQLFNSADVVILGRFVGKSAMAAVGNNMPVIGILVMLLMGISLGPTSPLPSISVPAATTKWNGRSRRLF